MALGSIKEAYNVFQQHDFSRSFQLRFLNINVPGVAGAQAVKELMVNGFDLYTEASQVHSFLKPPMPPFTVVSHINGPIYSSGRFWKSDRNQALPNQKHKD